MNRKLILLCCCTLSILYINAQTVLHFDKPFYFAGEYAFFKLYNQDLPPDSLVARVNIYGSSIQDYFHLKVTNKQTAGYWKLPYSLKSGVYHLEVYIFADEDATPLKIASAPINVYSGSEVTEDIPYFISDPATEESESWPSICRFDSEHQQWEALLSTSQVPDSIITVSVAVRERAYGNYIGHIQKYACEIPERQWLNLIPLYGKRSIEQSGLKSKLVFACDARTFRFAIGQTDANENFYLKMPSFYGERQIQFIDYLRNPFEVELREVLQPTPRSTSSISAPGIADMASDYQQRKKIYQLFNTIPQSIPLQDISEERQQVEPDYDLDVTDIAIRGKLFSVFKELVTPLKFRRQQDSTYHARVLYESAGLKQFYDRGPIFIINGQLTDDDHYVSQLPVQDVKRMKIYSELASVRSAFGPVGTGGIIEVEMIDPRYGVPENLKLPGVRVNGIQPPLQYPFRVGTNSEKPQLHSLLYWQPIVLPDEHGNYRIMFEPSDDQTEYEVEWLVQDLNGKLFISNSAFSIGPNHK